MLKPRVESTEIIAQINLFLDVLKFRGHGIRDRENPDCILDRVEYHKDEDEFYCFFDNQ